MAEYKKPLPKIDDPKTAPFWSAIKNHEISIQKCPKCGYVRYPAAMYCPECLDQNDNWAKMSGKGTVWSYGIYHHLYNEAFTDDIPYNVALVQLEEGPKLITNLVGIKNEDIKVNMPVEAVYDDVTPEVTLLKFKPTRSARSPRKTSRGVRR